MESTNWKNRISDLFESFREEFVRCDDYRGMDLDFRTSFTMKTGLSDEMFTQLNDISLEIVKNRPCAES